MNAFPWGEFARGLAPAAGAAALVMGVTYQIARRKGVHRIVDSAWGAGFAAVALVSWALSTGLGTRGDAARATLAAALTLVWGLRLAVHIGRRGRGRGEDPRYEKMLSGAPRGTSRDQYALRVVYLPQGALVWLVSLPVQAAMYVRGPLGATDGCAVALWALGLAFEAVGDAQMARFKAGPAHRGRMMDRGLWAWTRHPNYFGDFCVWWGLFLFTVTAPGPAGAVLVAPLLMSYLLVFGSGKALLERSMSRREGWDHYASRTSGFLPWPPGVWPKREPPEGS
ncbi:DUF1295 domain-containing protein [Streptomyces sp. NPDC007088]|uniref:DUF1295 domain-containing protein n=1 Tax=Streptomyces sp. NPDC007088 TaxID=3364773 RepID=UPI0036A9B7B1